MRGEAETREKGRKEDWVKEMVAGRRMGRNE